MGHVAKMRDNRWTERITIWYQWGKRRGGQRSKWRDEITNRNFERIAWDRQEWSRLSEAYAQNMGLIH